MTYRYQIQSPETQTQIMSAEHVGCMVFVLFFDGSGNPVDPVGIPKIERSPYAQGGSWATIEPFAQNEWRCNAYAQRVRVSMAGVTGYASYTVEVYRTAEPLAMIPDGAFTGMRAMTSQSYTEANVKNGVQYEVSSYNAALAASANVRTIFVTGAKTVAIKARLIAFDGAGIEARVYKLPTYSGGTVAPYYNLSDVNPVAGGVTILAGATVTNPGTEFGARSYLIGSIEPGSQSSGTFAVAGNERNLAANTAYMLELVSMDTAKAQRVSAYLSWYEGGFDLPVP